MLNVNRIPPFISEKFEWNFAWIFTKKKIQITDGELIV